MNFKCARVQILATINKRAIKQMIVADLIDPLYILFIISIWEKFNKQVIHTKLSEILIHVLSWKLSSFKIVILKTTLIKNNLKIYFLARDMGSTNI